MRTTNLLIACLLLTAPAQAQMAAIQSALFGLQEVVPSSDQPTYSDQMTVVLQQGTVPPGI